MTRHAVRLLRVPGLFLAAMTLLLGACGPEGGDEEDAPTARADKLEFSDSLYDGKYGNPTQCTVDGLTMHCCPSGRLMTGAHLDANIFRCTKPYAAMGTLNPFIDGPDGSTHVATQRQNMHACPLGTVMVGFHRARNDLLCAHLSLENPLSETVDAFTQDPAMPGHVCPAQGSPPFFTGAAMSGIRDDQNKFLCAS